MLEPGSPVVIGVMPGLRPAVVECASEIAELLGGCPYSFVKVGPAVSRIRDSPCSEHARARTPAETRRPTLCSPRHAR